MKSFDRILMLRRSTRTGDVAGLGRILAVALGLLAASGASPATAQDYYTDIRPLLVQNCMGCHTEVGPSWSMED